MSMARITRAAFAAAMLFASFAAVENARAEPDDIAGRTATKTYDMSAASHAPGYCQVTITSAAQALSTLLASGQGGSCSKIPRWVVWAYFLPENSAQYAVRCAADGTTITASLGWPLFGNAMNPVAAGVSGGPFSSLSCISATGSSVTLDIWWMG